METWATKNWVWCMKCLEWIDAANKASFVNIEEDIQGIDNMTFVCDKCGQESKSNVVAKETQPKSR
ncbi:MAG TPA: hypothetical protein DEO59_04170 [Balneola sp.]|nr:hypothetical protein [Balneola sp.]